MRAVKLLSCIIVAVALAMQIGSSAYCDDNSVGRVLRRMEGTITEVDTFNSAIAVQWQGADLIGFNVTTFIIPDGMQFYKGTDKVDILDISIGDPVTIEYYVDSSGTPKMVRMDINQ
ncbi:MAG: hypothetical protein KKE81_03570 [Candidatus Omnitrophica bacterium]|nr:hypothetical protein [Candidatus Omnitrophota bacterium]MBU1809382.1 hypothetical protein [Candidatus Omnitrophota bacterium]